MKNEFWYVRDRNKVVGPFDREQLESLRRRGQLARFHQVSQDRQTWVSAATLTDIFSAAAPVNEPEAQGPPVSEVPVWYYAVGKTQNGPVTTQALQQLLQQGTIGPDVLVWRDGLPSWVSLREAAAQGSLSFSLATPAPRPIDTRSAQQPRTASARSLFAFAFTYWLTIPIVVFGFACLAAGGMLVLADEMRDGPSWDLVLLGICFLFAGVCCWCVAHILALVLLYRTWKLIQPLRQIDPAEFNMPTPGTAVGLLFIPGFNFYWNFIAWHGLAARTNKYLARQAPDVSPMKEGLVLSHCILNVLHLVPYANALTVLADILIFFLVVQDVNRVANEIEARSGS